MIPRLCDEAYQGFLDLFLKPLCPLCRRSGDELICLSCQQQLRQCQFQPSRPFFQGKIPVFSWGMYGGKLREAIAALKYHNNPHLARPLGFLLGEAWLTSPLSRQFKTATVIPLPVHRQKLKERGFDQAVLLGKSFCQMTRLTYQPQGLERIKQTKPLFNLNASERDQQLQNAFAIGTGLRKRAPKSPVLLLDDIYTRGTTSRSATHILTQAGIPVKGVIALAKTVLS